jgi:hypothetical protein
MKIITVDNFDRESVAQKLVAENIKSKEHGRIMLEALQATCDNYSSTYFVLVSDDYKLWRGRAEFVDYTFKDWLKEHPEVKNWSA